ncbi:kinase [Candidatus Daviesbacteria bacterium]|nr:kinase [Candidatus Daviesbacteria bacterium]
MVISRTPFRISLFGGGTDYPIWYRKFGGSVISTSINKYCYIVTRYLPPFFPYKYRIRYTHRETTLSINQIRHPAVKETLNFLNINSGIEMVHTSDLPAMSGLGSSSSFTVGFLNSLYALLGKSVSKQQLARDAIEIEQNKIKENVGSQDQTIAAHGGLNRILFQKNGKIIVEPLAISRSRIQALEKYILLFFTGFQRRASDISAQLIKNTPNKFNELHALSKITAKAYEKLTGTNFSAQTLGKLLHENWIIKKSLASNISNQLIDEIYSEGISAGALGGKLLGAGSGGFIVFFVEPSMQKKFLRKFNKLLHVPFAFEKTGSSIIYNISD